MKCWLWLTLVILHSTGEIKSKPAAQDSNTNDDGPAAKCQDIYEKDKSTPSGYYDIKMGEHVVKVYCYFHNPQSSVIRQLYDLEGNAQEWHIDEPVGVSNGDPEGAMEMQVQPHEIPKGAGPHFMQPIIDAQEEMYFNKTKTIQNLIDSNNERERERKRQGNLPKQ